MSMDANGKRGVSVDAFEVKVLGGTFQIRELMLSAEQEQDDVRAIIREVPADRWFVMVSDDNGAHQDALAMIDDQLEFQIYAHGVLRQD